MTCVRTSNRTSIVSEASRRRARCVRGAGRQAPTGAAPARPLRQRRAVDRISPRVSAPRRSRVWRVRHPRDEPPADPRLATFAARRCEARVHAAVQRGRVRPRLSDQRHGLRGAPDRKVRRRRREGAVPAAYVESGHGAAMAGRPVHDGKGGRFRRGPADQYSDADRRRLAHPRREVVLFECRRGGGDAVGAAGRGAQRGHGDSVCS